MSALLWIPTACISMVNNISLVMLLPAKGKNLFAEVLGSIAKNLYYCFPLLYDIRNEDRLTLMNHTVHVVLYFLGNHGPTN